MVHGHGRRLHGGGGASLEKVSYRVGLAGKSEIARDTWLFRFEKPDGFDYRAGQHVRMSLLNPGGPAGDHRFWSFASAPYEPELGFAVRMRNSAFKTRLARLPVGASVQIDMLKNPPHGAFALDDGAEPIVFLAGGIGVVPALSMIKQALHDGSLRPITLVYSARSPADAPFLDDLRTLASQHENLTFIPTFTSPIDNACEAGERGRISSEMLKRCVPDLSSPVFYVSGLKGMVESLRAVLTNAGVAPSAILAEEFGSFSPVRAAEQRGRAGVLATIGVLLLAAIVTAAHVTPLWPFVRRYRFGWLLTQPLALAVAGAVLAVLLVKIGLGLVLWRKGKSLH